MASGFRVRFTKTPTAGTRGTRGQVGTQLAMTTPGHQTIDDQWFYINKPAPANSVVKQGARSKLPLALVRGRRMTMPPSSWPSMSPVIESQIPGFSQGPDESAFIRVTSVPIQNLALKVSRPTPPPGTSAIPVGDGNTCFGIRS